MICDIKQHNYQPQQKQHRKQPTNSPNEAARSNKKYFLLFPSKGKIGDNIVKTMKRNANIGRRLVYCCFNDVLVSSRKYVKE